jgi:hypothetical protein
MADNVNITEAGTTAIAADEIVDGALGTVKVQYVKLIDGSLGGSTKVIATSRAQPADSGLVVRQVPCTYEYVGPGVSTPQVLGGAGATGDYLEGVLIIPDTTSAGTVAVFDNVINFPIFTGGTNSLLDLSPIYVHLGIVSVSGPWKIGTGANVRCIAIGRFT